MTKTKQEDEQTDDLEKEADKEQTSDVIEGPPAGTEAPALVGSGAPMVQVRANAGVLGLSAGQIGNFARLPEVEANIDNGNLSVVE